MSVGERVDFDESLRDAPQFDARSPARELSMISSVELEADVVNVS